MIDLKSHISRTNVPGIVVHWIEICDSLVSRTDLVGVESIRDEIEGLPISFFVCQLEFS